MKKDIKKGKRKDKKLRKRKMRKGKKGGNGKEKKDTMKGTTWRVNRSNEDQKGHKSMGKGKITGYVEKKQAKKKQDKVVEIV